MRSSSLNTYNGHSEMVYSAKFAPHMTNIFSSVSADGFLKLWNATDICPIAEIKAHDGEVRLKLN